MRSIFCERKGVFQEMLELLQMPARIEIVFNDIDADLLYLNVFLDVGFKDDREYLPGAAHLGEHIMAKSVARKANPDGGPFLWGNAYTSREYTCFWHVIGSDKRSFLVSYIKEYLSFLQDTEQYGLINVEEERERLYEENNEVLANDLLMNLLFIELRILKREYAQPSFFIGTEEDYFDKLKVNAVRMIKECYRNSHITIIVTGKVSDYERKLVEELCRKRTVQRDRFIGKNMCHIDVPPFKRMEYLVYKMNVSEVKWSLNYFKLLAEFYQAFTLKLYHEKIILHCEVKNIGNEVLFVIFFRNSKKFSGLEVFTKIDFEDMILKNAGLFGVVRNEFAFALAEELCNPYKMNFQIYKYYHATGQLLERMAVLREIYNITEVDLQAVHNTLRKHIVIP